MKLKDYGMNKKATDIIKHLLDEDFNYDKTIAELDELRIRYRQQQDEDNANNAWAIITIVGIHRDFRKVYSMLKDRQYYDAWCLMEQIEIGVVNLLRNFKGVENTVKYISVIVRQLQGLYPYKLFMSTEVVIKERICSICGKQRMIRQHCGHFPGHVYMGELCSDIINKWELKGVSIVYNPEHKYAVAFLGDGKEGRKDHYNYMLLGGLMNFWKDPYAAWHYTIKHIHKSPDEFPSLMDDDKCPCGSGKKYSDCCKNDPEGIKHVVYEFRPGLVGV